MFPKRVDNYTYIHFSSSLPWLKWSKVQSNCASVKIKWHTFNFFLNLTFSQLAWDWHFENYFPSSKLLNAKLLVQRRQSKLSNVVRLQVDQIKHAEAFPSRMQAGIFQLLSAVEPSTKQGCYLKLGWFSEKIYPQLRRSTPRATKQQTAAHMETWLWQRIGSELNLRRGAQEANERRRRHLSERERCVSWVYICIGTTFSPSYNQ